MNIYLQELKFYRRSTLIWIAVFVVGILFYMSLFTAFTGDVTATMKILNNFPPAVRAALGIRLETFFTIFGFFGYLLTYLWLVGSIQAMNLGIGILSKEISGKTADFLLSKPVSRTKVLTSKLLAAVTLIVITNVFFVTAAYIAALIFSNTSFNTRSFMLIAGTMIFVQIFFLALGYLISVLVPKVKSVLAFSLPTVFGFFIVGMLDSVLGIDTIRVITPFKYFDTQYILDHRFYDPKYLIIELIVVVACIVATYIIYFKKDIQAGA
jgi:ABC-2 type transport system permease protein